MEVVVQSKDDAEDVNAQGRIHETCCKWLVQYDICSVGLR